MAGFYQKFEFGETAVHYAQIPMSQGKKTIGMALLPKGAPFDAGNFMDVPILHAAYSGIDNRPLKVTRQVQFLSGNLNTYLADEDGMEYVHRLYYERKTGVFSVSIRCENRSKEDKSFEKLSAFSFGGFPASKNTIFHRISGAYSHAFGLMSESLSALGLAGFRNAPLVRFHAINGEEGRYLPFAALSSECGALAVMMEPPQAWEIRLCRMGEGVNLFGGMDFFRGLSKRTLPAGGSYETSRVYFTFQPTLALALSALVKQQECKLFASSVEEELPVIFSTESISNLNKLSATLKNLNVSAVVFENSAKRPRTKEELVAATAKLNQAGMWTGIGLEDGIDDSDKYSLLKESGVTYLALKGRGGSREIDELRSADKNLVIEGRLPACDIEPFRVSKFNLFALPKFGAATAIAAANLSRILPSRQMLIDVPISAEETEEEIIFKLCSAMTCRIRLSGDLLKLDESKTELYSRGIRFYETAKEIIKNGTTILLDCDAFASEKPEGRQIYLREYGEKRLLIVHFFECENAVRIPLGGYEITESFTSLSNATRGEYLRIVGKSFSAGAFLLNKKREEI